MRRLPIWVLIVILAGACTRQTVVSQPQSQSQFQLAPALAVERFLQAANTRDLGTMSRLFGNADGPIGDSRNREEVELRMNVIAEILRHNDYEIVSEGRVPATARPNIRIGVDISISTCGTVRDVGFTVVQGSANRWLTNTIDLEKITECS